MTIKIFLSMNKNGVKQDEKKEVTYLTIGDNNRVVVVKKKIVINLQSRYVESSSLRMKIRS